MKKVAVMLVLSLMFVAALPVMSFAIGDFATGAKATTEIWKDLPDGTRTKTTKTVIEPSKSGAVAGAAAGATVGSVLGPVCAGVGAVIGGIAGWIYGPAD